MRKVLKRRNVSWAQYSETNFPPRTSSPLDFEIGGSKYQICTPRLFLDVDKWCLVQCILFIFLLWMSSARSRALDATELENGIRQKAVFTPRSSSRPDLGQRRMRRIRLSKAIYFYSRVFPDRKIAIQKKEASGSISNLGWDERIVVPSTQSGLRCVFSSPWDRECSHQYSSSISFPFFFLHDNFIRYFPPATADIADEEGIEKFCLRIITCLKKVSSLSSLCFFSAQSKRHEQGIKILLFYSSSIHLHFPRH